MVFWKYGLLSGLSRLPSGMFRKAYINGSISLQAISVSNFMFLKDKYRNGILKVRTTIRIVQSTPGDVPESGHLRNHVPTGNVDVKLHVFF